MKFPPKFCPNWVRRNGGFFYEVNSRRKAAIGEATYFDGVPIREIHEKHGLDRSTLKYYCALYRKWGDEPFAKPAKRKYTREMKLEAIHDILTNKKTYAQKALELMLTNPNIVGDWMEKYNEDGEEAIKDTYSKEAYKHHDDKVLEKEYKKFLEDFELNPI